MRNQINFVMFILLVLSLGLVAGCATIFTGSQPSTLDINTIPTQVKVTLTGGGMTNVQYTPCSIILNKNNDYTVVLEYEGYRSEQITIGRSIRGWFWGNILLGGIIGMAVDGVTGNMWDHNIHTINTELTKAKATGMLPDKVTIDYPISMMQENGQQVVQYMPVTFYKNI